MLLKTWTDVTNVGLKQAIDIVRQINQPASIEALFRLLVHRQAPRVFYCYMCKNCGHVQAPERASEEVSYCSLCFCYNLTYTVKVGQGRIKSQEGMDSLEVRIHQIRMHLGDMFTYYLGKPRPSSISFDCGFWARGVYAKFSTSDKVEGTNPKLVVLKSAILTPFLWDFTFDWSDYFGSGHVITPTMVFNFLMGIRK